MHKNLLYRNIFLIDEKVEETSEVNPEEKSFTKELALIKHTTEAMYKSLTIVGLETVSKE